MYFPPKLGIFWNTFQTRQPDFCHLLVINTFSVLIVICYSFFRPLIGTGRWEKHVDMPATCLVWTIVQDDQSSSSPSLVSSSFGHETSTTLQGTLKSSLWMSCPGHMAKPNQLRPLDYWSTGFWCPTSVMTVLRTKFLVYMFSVPWYSDPSSWMPGLSCPHRRAGSTFPIHKVGPALRVICTLW